MWKTIPSFERYEICRDTCAVRRIKDGRMPAVVLQHTGYLTVWLRREAKASGQYLRVHRLMWMTFVGPIGPDDFLNHIDGVKTNNRISNLEPTDYKHNMAHAARMGLMARGSRCVQSKLTEDAVLDIKRRIQNRETARSIARLHGVSADAIGKIKIGKNWRHVMLPSPAQAGADT